jgi:hypothetical protein
MVGFIKNFAKADSYGGCSHFVFVPKAAKTVEEASAEWKSDVIRMMKLTRGAERRTLQLLYHFIPVRGPNQKDPSKRWYVPILDSSALPPQFQVHFFFFFFFLRMTRGITFNVF